jgi:ferric-dicitrate binding protein FerR (iron transport regulator)
MPGSSPLGALSQVEASAYWRLANISGEMDEQALDSKRLLQEDRAHARDPRCLERYGIASFAATAAEYVHCLWHDVTIRTGEEYLPAPQLRRRLELLARWFPPDRAYALFPAGRGPSYSCSIQRRIRR